jgi:hypothetical protein
MSTKTQTLRRQAYVDDQLSVDEVVAFQEELSAEDKKELERERAYGNALAERLRNDEAPGCPDALWDDLKSRVLRGETDVPEIVPASPEPMRFTWLWQVVAVAAMIALVATLVNRVGTTSGGDLIAVQQTNKLTEFAALAEVRGDVDVIRAALSQAGFAGVDLMAPDPDAHHKIEFFGMRTEIINGKPAARLYIACCGRPATAIITADGGRLQFDESKINGTAYKATKKLGNGSRVTMVSPHPVKEVMDLFS